MFREILGILGDAVGGQERATERCDRIGGSHAPAREREREALDLPVRERTDKEKVRGPDERRLAFRVGTLNFQGVSQDSACQSAHHIPPS
jgi:hypothetical protein